MNRNWLWNVPNGLTIFRFFFVPVLMVVAFLGARTWFTLLFSFALLTDVLDGYLARKLKQITDFGTQLDGWADLAVWVAGLICFYILWPELARREAAYALFALGAFVLPMIVGYLKYKSVPSYHCYTAKLQAVLMGLTVLFLFLTEISWPFRCAAIFQGVAALEDISITILLPTCHHNIPSFWQAVKIKGHKI